MGRLRGVNWHTGGIFLQGHTLLTWTTDFWRNSDLRVWDVPNNCCVFAGVREAGIGDAVLCGGRIVATVGMRDLDRLTEGTLARWEPPESEGPGPAGHCGDCGPSNRKEMGGGDEQSAGRQGLLPDGAIWNGGRVIRNLVDELEEDSEGTSSEREGWTARDSGGDRDGCTDSSMSQSNSDTDTDSTDTDCDS